MLVAGSDALIAWGSFCRCGESSAILEQFFRVAPALATRTSLMALKRTLPARAHIQKSTSGLSAGFGSERWALGFVDWLSSG